MAFFAARAEEIDNELVERGPFGRLAVVEANGLTEVSLATLGEILAVGTYDDLVRQIADGPQAESYEAGVLTIPPAFTESIAGASDLDTVAERWASTEELTLDRWRPEDANEVLRSLRTLARSAADERRDLWYWWSL